MSCVYLAEDQRFQRSVVIKVLKPELTEGVSSKRFHREILFAARLQHPHIVSLLTAGEAAGLLYYVMPFVEGETVRQRLGRERQLPIDQVVGILRDVTSALAHAHRRGIVHRDIKPENVLLSDGGALVTDFGIAKALSASSSTTTSESTGATTLTERGLVLGTPLYMAPEQALGDSSTDHRADIYALGVLAYEMLAGRTPFEGQSPLQLFAAHAQERPKPITDLRNDVPSWLTSLVMQCLAKQPIDRPRGAQEVLAMLEGASTPARDSTPRPRPTPWVRLTASARRATLAVLVPVVAVPTIWWFVTRRAGEPRLESLVVLPFDNLSRDADQEYFVQGMHEAIIEQLSTIRALRVISRPSAMRYAGVSKPIPQIARELNVAAVIEGSVYRASDSVRIRVRLVGAVPNERVLWAQGFDGKLSDVLAVQGNVARAIADRMSAALTSNEQEHLVRSRVIDPEAHDAYLRGRYFQSDWTAQGARKSIQLFQLAISKDPTWAPAYSAIAQSEVILFAWGRIAPADFYSTARGAALNALALDSTLGEAHAQLATLSFYEWQWANAEREYQRALTLTPGSAAVHDLYAYFLETLGRREQSIEQRKQALALDPLSASKNLGVGLAYLRARRYSDAEVQLRNTLEMYPRLPSLLVFLGLTEVLQQRASNAVADVDSAFAAAGRASSDDAFLLALGGWIYAQTGQRSRARMLRDELGQLSRRSYVDPLYKAAIDIALGETDSALRWIEEGLNTKSALSILLKVDPWVDPVRSDPRFTRLLERMRFPS